MEVAQSHLEGLGDNPQGLKDTCLVVHLSLQRSLPGWMPAMTANKVRDRKVYKQLSFSNMLNTVQPSSPPPQTGSSASTKELCDNHVLLASKMEKNPLYWVDSCFTVIISCHSSRSRTNTYLPLHPALHTTHMKKHQQPHISYSKNLCQLIPETQNYAYPFSVHGCLTWSQHHLSAGIYYEQSLAVLWCISSLRLLRVPGLHLERIYRDCHKDTPLHMQYHLPTWHTGPSSTDEPEELLFDDRSVLRS